MNHRPYPHTCNMLDHARMLWDEADQMIEANIKAESHVHDPADISFVQDCAADIERFAHWPVVFAKPVCILVDDPDACECTERDCEPCDVCREEARKRAASEELEYTADVFAETFLHKVLPEIDVIREMARKAEMSMK